MTVVVETPDTRPKERDYILGVLLGEFLGLDWRRASAERQDVRLTLEGDARTALVLPDVLLQTPAAQWLASASLPTMPLRIMDVRALGTKARPFETTVPVIYGNGDQGVRRCGSVLHLSIDIFGSAFFMLTRYEEVISEVRDEHDRFPARASLAYQAEFLERPIVDEYTELLWVAMKGLWPGLRRKRREFAIKVSHDVDRPSRYAFGSSANFLRAVAGDVCKRGDLKALWRAPWTRWTTRDELSSKDPYNTFDWIMDVSEKQGLTSAFYFICGRTDAARDALYEPDSAPIRCLMRRIHERGHEIGLHPSYGTYQCARSLSREAERLKQICCNEGIQQDKWGGRMHYLRWRTPTTLRAWESASMTYDSTLGYADHVGFRCGTSHEYNAFDVSSSEQLRLRLRPLIVMEQTLLGKKYMGLPLESGYNRMRRLKNACKKYSGSFTVLWHNSELSQLELRELYFRTVCAGI